MVDKVPGSQDRYRVGKVPVRPLLHLHLKKQTALVVPTGSVQVIIQPQAGFESALGHVSFDIRRAATAISCPEERMHAVTHFRLGPEAENLWPQ
jgi:hypothetical protein